jgi:hypothetical protein
MKPSISIHSLSRIVILFFLSFLLESCGGSGKAGSTAPPPAETTIPAPAPQAAPHANGSPDSTQMNHQNSEPAFQGVPAEIAYNYPRTLIQNETKLVTVRASIYTDKNTAVQEVKMVALSSDSDITDNSNITDVIGCSVYDSLTVTIDDPDGDFQVKAQDCTARQKIDRKNGAVWQWSVNAKSTNKTGRLIINIDPQQAGLAKIEAKTIKIKIKLESFQDRLREYENYILGSTVLLGIILIPTIRYFGKRYFDNKKAVNNESN